MNQIMTQLLARQLGLSPENAATLQPSDIAAMLASRTSDPMMAVILSQLASQQPSTNTNPATEVDDSDQDSARELGQLKKVITQLRQQLAAADVMARYIADIFGACPTCWGLNRLCSDCGGKGKPGYTEPDIEELRNWVEPALKKGGLNIGASTQP